MRKPFLILLLSFWILSLWASPVGLDKARQAASSFMGTSAQKLKVSSATSTRGDQTDPCYYVFEMEGGGFIIISGDDAAEPVLGYSATGKFPTLDMPANLRYWTGLWEEQILSIRERNLQPSGAIQEKWANISSSVQETEVLLETAKWRQDGPFNLKCTDVLGENVFTGCVATAAAIVMRYHQWPEKGTGTVPSYAFLDGMTYVKVPAHELGDTYNYQDMPIVYQEGAYTETQAKAVANLMYDIGTASRMEYYTDGSGSSAFTDDLIKAMAYHMQYRKDAREALREEYTDREWFALLKNEIKNVGPVIYGGDSKQGYGHQFLLDGYDRTSYFHVNWGWGGDYDGFFLLSNLNPNSWDFSSGQSAVIGLMPDRNASSQQADYLLLFKEGAFNGISVSNDQPIEKGKAFTAKVGAVYNNNAIESFNGVVAVGLYDSSDQLKAIVSDYTSLEDLFYLSGYTLTFPCLIEEDIEPGDRLRPYFKGEHSEGFIKGDYSCQEYVMLSYENHTEAEIAKVTTCDYDAVYQDLAISCQYPAVFKLEDESGNDCSVDELHYKNGLLIPVGKMKGKVLHVTIQCGNGSYSFNIKL